MALRGGLIDREDVDDCIDAFDKLDQNHSGTLTIEDCYFIPDRVAKLGRHKVLAELSKLESALNEVTVLSRCLSVVLGMLLSSACWVSQLSTVFHAADGLCGSLLFRSRTRPLLPTTFSGSKHSRRRRHVSLCCTGTPKILRHLRAYDLTLN